MSGIKQKRKANRQQKRLSRHKRSILCISSVIILLVAVVSVSGVALQTKNKAYIAQEQELQEQIDEEKARAQEIEELEQYVGTDEYVEQTAKDKLGLVHEGEIIFKAK
ncbi:FtsB family cell division protein [Sporofaciens sp. SGI.106]|uniref:FtsB family cell division protein n=1 Tax=Sporofaciens sp. SGI.106 TaxID=3420568 RepID=UPI002A9D86B8|nr:septum formation initiator family protein [Lachnoclostridium sp.]